jgi:hypothetical protein
MSIHIKNEIIRIIGKLDNGSHSSNQLQGIDESLTKLFEEEVNRYKEALIWCSGSEDFNVGGKAREGWLKLCEPLIKNNNHDITHRIYNGICLNCEKPLQNEEFK